MSFQIGEFWGGFSLRKAIAYDAGQCTYLHNQFKNFGLASTLGNDDLRVLFEN